MSYVGVFKLKHFVEEDHPFSDKDLLLIFLFYLFSDLEFAGPFFLLNRKVRGAKLIKCYLYIFICLRYKCIHLDAVSDLSKDTFIVTLKLFISRRAIPSAIFCDNGHNFVDTARESGDFFN